MSLKGIYLWPSPNYTGAGVNVDSDTTRLPDPIYKNSDSISVVKAPVALFPDDNYAGTPFVITVAGGWQDMSNMPDGGGNWKNRVASVRFALGLNTAALAEQFPEAQIISAEHLRGKHHKRHPRDGYTATFVNRFPQKVALEVVSGNNQDCHQNTTIQYNDILYENDGSASIATDDPVVCYRRTADPSNPQSPLGEWKSIFLDDNNPHQTIEL
jgi:hypothetical protein